MGKPSGDHGTVVLRREPGRMVIDVLVRGNASRSEDRMVEILNAYPLGTSLRVTACSLLRSVACAQRAHHGRIAEAQAQLEAARKSLEATQQQWDHERSAAREIRKDRMRRFYLLLNAKIDKEHALRTEATERRRAQLNLSEIGNGRSTKLSGLEDNGLPVSRSSNVLSKDVPQLAARKRKHREPSTVVAPPARKAGNANEVKPAIVEERLQPLPHECAGGLAVGTMSLFNPVSSDEEDNQKNLKPTIAHIPEKMAMLTEELDKPRCDSQKDSVKDICLHPSKAFAKSLFDSDSE